MAPIVELAGIHKRFPGVVALAGVDLALAPGRIHALVGENGAGKSTLLNILAGLLQPDGGEVRLDGRAVTLGDARAAWAVGIVTVHQEVDLFADLSVLENIGWHEGLPTGPLGWIDWRQQRRRTAEALAAVDHPIGPDRLAGELTPAQRQLVEIAGAIAREARVLVLDEPTSSLSAGEAERLFGHLRRLRAQGTAIVYVSHRLEEVFALADEITVLRDGRRVWTGAAAETSSADLIRHMVGRPVSAATRRDGNAGPVQLSCTGLTGADGAFRDVSLEARGGEVLGLYGLIGAGRSEWAQAVFGLRPIGAGELRVGGKVAYVPEDRARQGLCRGLSVRVNAVLASLRRLATWALLPPGRETKLTGTLVQQLGVRLASQEQPIGTLSGGNQQKVVLGRWLATDPAVLILDEPTRGVDVGAREEIYTLVRRQADAGRAVVLISSDLPEVMSQSDRIGVFRHGRLVAVRGAEEWSAEEVARLAFPVAGEARRAGGVSPRSQDSTTRRALTPGADAPGSPAPGADAPGSPRLRLPPGLGLALFVAAFFVVVHLLTGKFLLPSTLVGLVTDASLLGICALGALLVLLVGGLDISLGALMCLSAAIAGKLWQQGQPFAVVVGAAVAVGAAGGALNATLSLVGRVHPIVITLGTMSAYRGLAQWYLGGEVTIPNEQREWLIDSTLGVPVVAWLWLGLLVALWLWLTRFTSGRELYAVGSNPQAARRVGVSLPAAWLRAFAVQGALVGLAGVFYLARSGQLQPTSHEERTLEAIAAAVVGGVAITGGRGGPWGVALGALFLVSLAPASIHLGLPPTRQQALIGVVLLAAVVFDRLVRRRGA